MTRIHIILLALALFHSGAAPAAARESIAPQPNDRVRLSVSTSDLIRVLAGAPMTAKELRHEQFIGTLQGRRDDDIVIRVESPETELAVPVKSVVRIEASRGMQGCAGDGAAAGLGVGAVAGVLLGVVACSQGDCEGTPGEGRGARGRKDNHNRLGRRARRGRRGRHWSRRRIPDELRALAGRSRQGSAVRRRATAGRRDPPWAQPSNLGARSFLRRHGGQLR